MRHYFTVILIACLCSGLACHAQTLLVVQNKAGLRLLVTEENTNPALAVILPGHPDHDRTIFVFFPEHVTVRKSGEAEGNHLYLFRPGRLGVPPPWRQVGQGQSLQYERDLENGLQMLARVTLDDDGVRFHYEFANRSNNTYELIYAPTDPRLTSIFHDIRLERTYVHHADGFDLLASETPGRLTRPLNQWLPARYLASFTWPILGQAYRTAGRRHHVLQQIVPRRPARDRDSLDRRQVSRRQLSADHGKRVE